eukprot:6211752-Pleurochrysis_carterae.AAC.3
MFAFACVLPLGDHAHLAIVIIASSTSGSTAAAHFNHVGHDLAEPSTQLLWLKESGDSGAGRRRAGKRKGELGACSVHGEHNGVSFGDKKMAKLRERWRALEAVGDVGKWRTSPSP